jgi:type IV pilus assembly protein PilC
MVAVPVGIGVAIRTDRGRYVWHRTLLRTPVLGDVIQHALLERFCRVLGSLMEAGVTLTDAMRVTMQAVSNVVFQRGLSDARQAMMRGEGLARPLADTGLFPAAARQMFRVGEATGTLDQQLMGAAEYFDRELDYKIKRFTSIFEPATLIFVGLVVGFVAIALVSAMYGIFRQVHP